MEVDPGAHSPVSHTGQHGEKHNWGCWNASMGSSKNGPSLRRSLIDRAFWWHLGNMISLIQAEGERKKARYSFK